MHNSEGNGHVPTSHYHLSLWQIVSVILVFAGFTALVLLGLFLFTKQEKVMGNIPRAAATEIVSQQNSYISEEYINRLAGTEMSVSVIYPPPYELTEAETDTQSGLLKYYVFDTTERSPDLPGLLDFSFSTAESLSVNGEAVKVFELEKSSVQKQEEVEGRELSVLDGILFLVRNVPMETGDTYVREYTTFAGETRVQIRIAIPSPSLSMQADELFRQVHLVAVKGNKKVD